MSTDCDWACEDTTGACNSSAEAGASELTL